MARGTGLTQQHKPLIIPIAGFLGAGKTTLVLAAARVLRKRNLNCAAILNDHGGNLVDTEHVREQQISANEVAGGCFCCRFSGLIDRADELRELKPDVIFLEAVGSCADLSATVIQPLKRDFRDRFRIAPLTVVVDPAQARQMSGLPESSELGYLFHRQIDEADLVAFTKCDLRFEFRHTPSVESKYLSSLTGEGVSEWLDEVMSGVIPAGAKILQIDYERYAQAEAALAWLNWRAQIQLSRPLSTTELVGPFLDALQEAIRSHGGEIMHLKISDDTDSSYLKVSITSSNAEPHAEGDLTASPELQHELRLNLRAVMGAEALQNIFRRELDRVPGRQQEATLECFEPSRPEPQQRFSEVVRDTDVFSGRIGVSA